MVKENSFVKYNSSANKLVWMWLDYLILPRCGVSTVSS